VSDDRKRPAATGPDEADYCVWDVADTVERLRTKAGPSIARQAARAAREALAPFESHLSPAVQRARQRAQEGC
jgi:hypothetical protein